MSCWYIDVDGDVADVDMLMSDATTYFERTATILCYSNKVTSFRSKQQSTRMHWPNEEKTKWNKSSEILWSPLLQQYTGEHRSKTNKQTNKKCGIIIQVVMLKKTNENHPFDVILKTNNSNISHESIWKCL